MNTEIEHLLRSNERLLTTKEVAQYLGVHRTTVEGLAQSGELPAFTVGRQRRFCWSDLRRWLASQHSSAPAAA